MRRKLRRLASSSRNARATVQGSDGRLLLCQCPSSYICAARRVFPGACVPCRLQNTCAGARLAARLICGELLGELAT